MDYTQFEYLEKPSIQNKTYGIRPLTEQGFRKYISHESYVHNFLDKTKLTKMFPQFQDNKENNETSTNFYNNLEHHDTSIKQDLSEKSKIEYPNSNSNYFLNPKKNRQRILSMTDINGFDKNTQIYENSNNDDKNCSRSLKPNKSCINFNFKKYDEKNKKQIIQIWKNRSMSLSQPKNNRCGEDIKNKVKEINFKLNTQNIQISEFNKNVTQSLYDGFVASNVPRIRKETNVSIPVNVEKYTQRIAKSVLSSREKQTKESIDEENTKFKKILLNQTNSNFLKKFKLPTITNIAEQPKIKISRASLGNSKFMGGKYDPYTFIPLNKNWLGRNPNGGLFQH